MSSQRNRTKNIPNNPELSMKRKFVTFPLGKKKNPNSKHKYFQCQMLCQGTPNKSANQSLSIDNFQSAMLHRPAKKIKQRYTPYYFFPFPSEVVAKLMCTKKWAV